MTSFKRASRTAILLSMFAIGAYSTNGLYQPQLYLNASNDVHCPNGMVLMCKNPNSAQECSCTPTSTFWAD